MRAAFRETRRIWLSAAIGGGLLALTHPTVDSLQLITGAFWVFPGVALLYWAVRNALSGRMAFQLGWLAGVIYFAITLHWIAYPFLTKAETHLWLLPFALVLTPIGFGLFWAGACWLIHRIHVSGIAHAIAFTVVLSLAEWLRGTIFTGFPWALLGYAWLDTPIQYVLAWVGIYGLTALTLLIPAMAVAVGELHALRQWGLVLRMAVGMLVAGTLVGGAWGFGNLTRDAMAVTSGIRPTVRIVQPNIPQREKWAEQFRSRNLNRLIALSKGDGTESVDLIVWPEAAVPAVLPRTGREMGSLGGAPERMTELLAPTASLLTGAQTVTHAGDGFNSLAALSADGTFTAIYDKHHLVPFGEYIPLWGVLQDLGIGTFTVGGFATGPGPHIARLSGLPPFAPLICYEAIFPDEVRSASSGASWILQVTNDAWFGPGAGPRQHLQHTRARAIELGLPLIRVANTGISAVIDAHGRIADSIPLGRSGTITRPLPPASADPTFYMIHGNLVFWTWLSGGMIWVLLARRMVKH